jgi:TRAP-type mannitol/chloroaromatic compound transport system permease small subunit
LAQAAGIFLMVRIIERISHFTGVAAAWLIVPLIFATVYEVASRYVFNAPTIWAYEIGYLMTGSSFLIGMAYALSRDAHIRIDVVSAHLSQRTRAIIDLLCYVGLLIPFLLWVTHMLWTRALAAIASGEKSGQSAWNPPLWPFRTVFFIAFALLVLQVIAEVIKCVRRLRGAEASAR